MTNGKRQKRKLTNKEIVETLEDLANRHNHVAQFVMTLGQHMEQLSTLLHMALLENGQALKAECSACGTSVVYPNLPEFSAHPICPNSHENEACKTGFDHIPMPEDLTKGQASIEDYLAEKEEE